MYERPITEYCRDSHFAHKRRARESLRQMRRDGILPRDYEIPIIIGGSLAMAAFAALVVMWWLGW